MASNTDYDPELAGDIVTAKAKKQTSFDQTNLPAQYQQPAKAPTAANPPAGPVGRAALQLPETAVTAAAPTAAPSQSLESLRRTGIGDGRSAIYAGVGANGEASFSNLGSTLDTLSKNFTAPNQAPDQRLSAMPGLNPSGNGVQQPAQRFPTSLADLSPGGPSAAMAAQPVQRSASLTDALPGYTPSSPAQSPAEQQRANLADAWRGGQSSGPGFAALGSSANMGDGVGTFSQASQGDAQLAMGRFQKAADLREGYKAQDRLDQALGAKWQADHTNVVHDSSRPVTARELKTDAAYEQMRNGAARNVDLAQAGVDVQQNRQAAGQQMRQSQRLEDAWMAAIQPNATDANRQAYRAMTDPFNKQGLAQQLTQAQIDEKSASAQKLRAEAAAAGGPGKMTEQQAKDLQYFGRGNAANAELGQNGLALTESPTGGRGYVRSGLDTALRALPVVGQSGIINSLVSDERQKAEQSGREFINAILRKDSGAALTEPEIAEYGRTYLPQAGDGEAVLKQKQAARERAIQGIRDGLGSAAILAAETNRPEYKSASSKSGQATGSAKPLRVKGHEDVMGLPSGTLFVAPDGKTRRVP